MSRSQTYKASTLEQRVVKLLLPLPVIRAMDRLLVEGVGGFSTRNEFVREAVESYIVELTHEPAPAEPAALVSRRRGRRAVAPTLLEPVQSEIFDVAVTAEDLARPIAIEETSLKPLPEALAVMAGDVHVIDQPLFGMHNRDYPSLWAARRLAEYLQNGSLSFGEFAERATTEAWAFANALRSLERELGQKLTALFPTNAEKRQTASSAFRSFGIGNVTPVGERVYGEGPLLLWRVIDVALRDGADLVGFTKEGRELLERLAGLTVVPPHKPEHARVFLAHLREHAPADWWGFEQTLLIVAERPTRVELVERFQAAKTGWSESVAATNVQGYVARAREWGLIVPKVVDARYELTGLGAELAEGATE